MEVFANIKDCQEADILKCASVNRIKIILNKFNAIINNTKESHRNDEFLQLLADNNYTNTQLMNDFHHIKYHHAADSDHHIFAKVYNHINSNNNPCHLKQCKHVQRHYRDRSRFQLFNQYNDENEYIINLISRVHVYFIHSYDINRLTMNEIKTINQQLELLQNAHDDKDEFVDEILQDKKMEMITLIINKKRKHLNSLKNDNICDDFIDKAGINCQAIYDMLKKNNINLESKQIENAFIEYNNDDNKNKFINDIIEAYYHANDQQFPLLNKINRQTLHLLYQHILYQYIQKHELDNANFIKIAKIIIHNLHYDDNININEFEQIARNSETQIDGKIFVKGTAEFKKSTQFALLFKSMIGYKKKTFAQIYVKINKWTPIPTKPSPDNIDEKKEEIKTSDDEKKDISDDDKKTDVAVYDLGVRFYYWDAYKYHQHYITANYSNLKEEMTQNKLFKFEMKSWNSLEKECQGILATNYVKYILCNGYHEYIYGINPYSPFSIKHLIALKLYTDYTTFCNIFCSTIRLENKMSIAEIANWVRLLCECVQCYGTSLKSSKRKRYYRGVGIVFKFEMFVTRFNLPTSTTIDFNIAVSKFTNGGNGLVLELRPYSDHYDVFKFDCYPLSDFPEEKEILFFGGDTVLRIATINQVVDCKWISYRKYIEPMNIILRLINGLTIKGQRILTSHKQQQTMLLLINHILPTFALQNQTVMVDTDKLPLYICDLLTYHVSNPIIKLNYIELSHEYKWMKSTFIKNQANTIRSEMPYISKICILFSCCDELIFYMPTNYVLSKYECLSLIEELGLISTMNIMIIICFKWSSPMPSGNKLRINEYLQEHNKWSSRFSTDYVSFEYIGRLQYSYNAQTLFQSNVEQMVHQPVRKEVSKQLKINEFKEVSNAVRVVRFRREDFHQHCIFVIEWFIRTQLTLFIPQPIVDLIIFYTGSNVRRSARRNAIIYTNGKAPNVYSVWNSVHPHILITRAQSDASEVNEYSVSHSVNPHNGIGQMRFADHSYKIYKRENERHWRRINERLNKVGIDNLLMHMNFRYDDDEKHERKLDEKYFVKQAKLVYNIQVDLFYDEIYQDIITESLGFDAAFNRKDARRWIINYELNKLHKVIIDNEITRIKFKNEMVGNKNDVFCKKYMAFLPKKRRKVLFKKLKKDLPKDYLFGYDMV